MPGLDAPPAELRAARTAALAAGAAAVDAEIARAPVDDSFVAFLRACAYGAHRMLAQLCDRIGDPGRPIDEAPALALLEAVGDEARAERAVRAAVWVMVARRVAQTWPLTWFEVFAVAREAMPMDEHTFERVRGMVGLVTVSVDTEDAGDREGMRFQFLRESLETVIAAAVGYPPQRREMLDVVQHWTACFAAGMKAADARLRELA